MVRGISYMNKKIIWLFLRATLLSGASQQLVVVDKLPSYINREEYTKLAPLQQQAVAQFVQLPWVIEKYEKLTCKDMSHVKVSSDEERELLYRVSAQLGGAEAFRTVARRLIEKKDSYALNMMYCAQHGMQLILRMF